jgi:ABC-type sugar transport system substrate-binding protein
MSWSRCGRTASATEQEITMSGKRTLIALSAAIALGVLGAASAAQAGNQGEDTGGFVMPGSMVGVNPVYHPGWFGRHPEAAADRAGNAYGYAPLPIHRDRPLHARAHDRR